MHLLFETALGYALFKVDDDKFNSIETYKDLPSNLPGVKKILQL